MANKKQIAEDVLTKIGGKENVEFSTHCLTRLRFNLKDQGLVDLDEVKAIPGVLGAIVQNGQTQVIIGESVGDVYDELCNIAGFAKTETINENLDMPTEKKKFSFGAIFDVLSGCFGPIIPALAGAGIMKGLLTLCTTYHFMANDSGVYLILNAAADSAFYFLPFLLAVTAAKKFKTNITMAVVVAGIYMYPSIMAGAGKSIDIVGLDVTLLKYSSTVVPILLSVWIMSYIYRIVNDHTISYLRVVVVPIVTILIMAPLSIIVLGPLGYYAGVYVGELFKWLFDIAPWLGGLIDGATRPWVILTGMHMAMSPIMINNIETLGYDMLGPVHACASMAAAGMCFGAFLKARNVDNKSASFTSFISAFIGITEPAIYGVAFRFKKPLWALMIGGGVSGAIVSMLGGKAMTFAMPSPLSLPAYTGSIPAVVIGMVIAFILTAGLTYLFGLNEAIEKDQRAIEAEKKAVKLGK